MKTTTVRFAEKTQPYALPTGARGKNKQLAYEAMQVRLNKCGFTAWEERSSGENSGSARETHIIMANTLEGAHIYFPLTIKETEETIASLQKALADAKLAKSMRDHNAEAAALCEARDSA